MLTLLVPMVTESHQWFVDVTPALFLLACVGVALGWRRYRARGTVNLTSGLPNLTALARQRAPARPRADRRADHQLSATRRRRVAAKSERALVDQIVQRLTVGAQDHVIFQGDEGIFAWLTEPGTAIGHHVEALHSLFRSPARIDGDDLSTSTSPSGSRSAAAGRSPSGSTARWSPPTKPRAKASSGNITIPSG